MLGAVLHPTICISVIVIIIIVIIIIISITIIIVIIIIINKVIVIIIIISIIIIIIIILIIIIVIIIIINIIIVIIIRPDFSCTIFEAVPERKFLINIKMRERISQEYVITVIRSILCDKAKTCIYLDESLSKFSANHAVYQEVG